MAYPGFGYGDFQPQRGDHLRDLVPEGLRVGSGSGHHHHEVIRVADDPVGGPAPFPVGFSAIRCAMGIPMIAEMLIQYRQSNIGQQRGDVSSLRGPCVDVPDLPRSGHDACFEELADQGQDAFVGDRACASRR